MELNTWTLNELERRRCELEEGASLALGRLVMGFSRLDVALGLALVWINHGVDLEERTERFEASTFHVKLADLERRVGERYPTGEGAVRYAEWLAQAHALRRLRNELMHGRWGTSPTTNSVVNVLGLPTSPHQQEVHYTLQQLDDHVADVSALRERLETLREECPLK